MKTDTLFHSTISSLPLLARGKVRDIYAIDEAHLLIVTTDRLSAFDVVLPDPIPGKGQVLNAITVFWLQKFSHFIKNQLTGIDPESVVAEHERQQVRGRSLVVKRLKPLPIEAVVRGYLIGSGWKDYQQTGAVCGIRLPAGLSLAAALPSPIFTPATKADIGDHDINISFAEACGNTSAALSGLLWGTGKNGAQLVAEVRSVACALYREAAAYALARGVIIADTKFEFGVDAGGELYLIDEVLTPDSSRFWPVDGYALGVSPPSYDKQYVRDYLDTLDWNKTAPGPHLPAEVISRTAAKYREALNRLCFFN